jgi:hypothetical protein
MDGMDELTVSISPAEPNGFLGGVYFLVTASVNGTPLFDYLDVDEFFKSLDPESGEGRRNAPRKGAIGVVTRWLPIFNCDCGVFGCGGYHVDVTLTRDALLWEGASPDPNAIAAGTAVVYSFPWRNVRDVAGELIAAIYTAQAQSPSGEVRYGTTGVEVTERLPYYLERYEALAGHDMDGGNPPTALVKTG